MQTLCLANIGSNIKSNDILTAEHDIKIETSVRSLWVIQSKKIGRNILTTDAINRSAIMLEHDSYYEWRLVQQERYHDIAFAFPCHGQATYQLKGI